MKKMLLAILLCQSAYSEPELKGHPDELKVFLQPRVETLTLAASAEESAYSDQAIISVLVTTDEKTMSSAIKANNEARKEFIEFMGSSGVASDRIKNAKFSSSPQYGWFGKKPDSYKIINRVSINIRSEAELQKVAEYTDRSEYMAFTGVEFVHSAEEQYRQRVKTKALEKVMEKKSFYEKNLSLKLTPISFKEDNVDLYPTAGANQIEEVIVTGIRASSNNASYKSKQQMPLRKSTFDEVNYSARVAVEFKVEPLK